MTSQYQVSTTKLRQLDRVWNRLKTVIPEPYKHIQVGLVFTEAPHYKTYQGGYATESTINIGTEYLNKATRDIALAEILAHELGHHVMGHVLRLGEGEINAVAEQDADHFGMFLCELAGYKRHDYIAWFEEFEKRRQKTLSEKHKREHGTGSERVRKLRKQDIYLTEIENF